MEKQTGKQLLTKLKEGNISSEELKLLESWYDDYMSKEVPFDDVHIFLKDMEILDHAFPFEMEKPVVKRTTYKLWPRLAAAASAVAVLALGVYLFNSEKASLVNDHQTIVQDITPGKVGATLTLASGKKIRLTDVANGELANEAGIVITKTKAGQLIYEIKGSDTDPNQINTLSTNKGETYQVRLPDGSMVYLNAASSLTYAAALIKNGKRMINLQGEGYFEVSKDKKHPFVVQTEHQEIEVLGTHFNVMAYADEPAIATTLLEGSVKIATSSGEQLLKPNEQALNNGRSIKVVEANLENITDWKEGDFYFERVDFRSVMRKIARWYDVEVIYDRSVSNDIKSGGWISRNNKLSTVLKSIEKSGQVHFKIDGKKIYVTK